MNCLAAAWSPDADHAALRTGYKAKQKSIICNHKATDQPENVDSKEKHCCPLTRPPLIGKLVRHVHARLVCM